MRPKLGRILCVSEVSVKQHKHVLLFFFGTAVGSYAQKLAVML